MTENDRPTEDLTVKQAKLIESLLAGHTITYSAAIVGCTEKTARTWLKLPHVQDAYRAAQDEVFGDAIAQLKIGTIDAVKQLHKDMLSEETDVAVRVRATLGWITKGIEQSQANELKRELREALQRLENGR